jgi:hypothetical protein
MQIETGNIHNPHYYEYQRMNGTLQRNPGDVPCGDVNRFPSAYDVRIAVYRGEYGLTYLEFIDKFLRLGIEMEAFLPRNRVEDSNLENRKSFMRGKISEYQFKFRIQKNEKHREKKRDIRNIHDMFVNVSKDLFAQLVNRTVDTREFIDMAKNLVVYMNDSLRKTKVLYDNCVMEFIDVEKLEMVSDSKKRKSVVPV